MTTKRRTLEEIAEELAGPHDYVEEDEWYSCGMATTPGEPERPGCSDESKRGRCSCRRSERVAKILAVLREAAAAARDEEREALREQIEHQRLTKRMSGIRFAWYRRLLTWLDARSRAEKLKV